MTGQRIPSVQYIYVYTYRPQLCRASPIGRTNGNYANKFYNYKKLKGLLLSNIKVFSYKEFKILIITTF